MKKLFYAATIAMLFSFVSANADYYYYKSQRIDLTPENDKFLVKFSRDISSEKYHQIVTAIRSAGFEADDDISAVHQYNTFILRSDNGNAALDGLFSIKGVVSAGRMYKLGNGYFACTDEVAVKLFGNSKAMTTAKELASRYGCISLRQCPYSDAGYILTLPKGRSALQLANDLYESHEVEYAEPNFMSYRTKHTSDSYYGDQWPLKNTANPGADIHIEDAWNITKGKSQIHIAVVDDGVQLHHPDLEANLLPGYSVTGTNTTGGEATDDHGTGCAGIIGAVTDNGQGIAGVCPECKIIPVCAYQGNYASPDMEAEGIAWASGQMPNSGDADVISCSWEEDPSWQIDAAIDDATNYGRGGLGCVILFSSGNDGNGTVSYPASSPKVIAVGASTDQDKKWSSSNFGSDLDVVAPGGTSNITTTDINSSYTSTFNGTSASCPHAAGVIGLMLSVNPCLNWSDAATVLELSCDKIDDCNNPYSTNGWDGRNDKVGFGRVNGYRAVTLALNFDNYFHSGSSDLGITNAFSQWILSSGHCFPAATYFSVDQHKVQATITLPYAATAPFTVTTNGISGANPNNGATFFTSSINGNQLTLQAFTYFIQMNAQAQQLNVWYPAAPSDIWFAILPGNSSALYFQNRTEDNLSDVYRTFDKIWAGYNVTTQVPFGDYVLNANDDVKFVSGKSVNLQPGFFCKNGNTFLAIINGFNTCEQYPDPLHKPANTSDPHRLDTVIKMSDVQSDKNFGQNSAESTGLDDVSIFPNPTNGISYLRYFTAKNTTVSVGLVNVIGQHYDHLIGSYEQAPLPGMQKLVIYSDKLEPGIYYCTLTINGKNTIKRLTVQK